MRTRARIQLLVALAVLAGGPVGLGATATAGETIDRFGRLWGYGWSDGYHTCTSGGHRVGRNLPPLSYSTVRAMARGGAIQGVSGHGIVSRELVTGDPALGPLPIDRRQDHTGLSSSGATEGTRSPVNRW